MAQTKEPTETNTVPLTANGRTEYFSREHADAVLKMPLTEWKEVKNGPAAAPGKAAPAAPETSK